MPGTPELRLLADYIGGAQTANNWVHPSPTAVNGGPLQSDQRAEIEFMEIRSPVTGAGVSEALKKITLNLDTVEYDAYVSLSGIRESNMAPPKSNIPDRKIYRFGVPHSCDPVKNTTLKYKQNLSINALAGGTNITQPYRIRLYGYVYNVADIPNFFQWIDAAGVIHNTVMPSKIVERTRNRVINIPGGTPISGDTWDQLSGGRAQPGVKVNPFIRYAYNLNATNGQQGDYTLSFYNDQVLEKDEDMHFAFDAHTALLIERLGIKADSGGLLARFGLQIGGSYHPAGPSNLLSLFETALGVNERDFGYMYPSELPAIPLFAAIPQLETKYMIWNEIGDVIIRDNGAGAVPANGITAALAGIMVEGL